MCIQHIMCICIWMCDIYAHMFRYWYNYMYLNISRIGTQRWLEMMHLCMNPETLIYKCFVLVVKMTFITHCCLWIHVCFMDLWVSKCICVTLSCYQKMTRWISRDLNDEKWQASPPSLLATSLGSRGVISFLNGNFRTLKWVGTFAVRTICLAIEIVGIVPKT